MQTRKDIKTEAKMYLRKYYWPSVFTSILLGLFGAVSFISVDKLSSDDVHTVISIMTGPDMNDSTIMIIAGAAVLIILAILLTVFVTNVIRVGGAYFHLHCRHAGEEGTSCADVFWGFRGEHYFNAVRTMFMKKLFIALWSLLLIVPGIIKSYQYAMVEYIITENTHLTYKEALDTSIQMMKGYKWKYFVLQISFILWYFLNILTLGLIGIFWLNPYKQHTYAAFYESLKEKAQTAEV